MIYLASPYSHPDPAVRQQRYETVCHAAAELMLKGHRIYSPIAMTHGICLAGDPTKFAFEFWADLDKEMIQLCLAFWILRMDGWEKSEGIKKELAYALSLGKDVHYV